MALYSAVTVVARDGAGVAAHSLTPSAALKLHSLGQQPPPDTPTSSSTSLQSGDGGAAHLATGHGPTRAAHGAAPAVTVLPVTSVPTGP